MIYFCMIDILISMETISILRKNIYWELRDILFLIYIVEILSPEHLRSFESVN